MVECSEKNIWNSVITHFQWMSILIGGFAIFMFYIINQYVENDIWKLIAQILNVFGGSLLSIGLVTIFYQKWKDQQDREKFQELKKQQTEVKSCLNDIDQQERESFQEFKKQQTEVKSCLNGIDQQDRENFHELKEQQTEVKRLLKEIASKLEKKNNDKYFLMGPSSYRGSGQELEEIANIDTITGKILLIGSMSGGKIKEEYAFTTLLGGDNFRLLEKNKPIFSYGTSFPFFNKKEMKPYYDSFEKAIKEGLGLNVSIIYPDEKIADIDNIKKKMNESGDTIKHFKDMISTLIKEKKEIDHPIELRLSRYFSPCSFSSVEFTSGRTIRTLEFNFMHEGNEGDGGVKLSQIHDNPPKDKEDVHGKFSEYLYNRYKRLYEESIVALRYPMKDDIIYYVLGIVIDVPNDSNEQSKYAIVDDNIPKLVVHQNQSDGCLSVISNSTSIDYNAEIKPKFQNTIIGNVLVGYKKQIGGIVRPIKSFEISSNTFLLLGSVVKTPKDSNLSVKRLDLSKSKDKDELDNRLTKIGCESRISDTIKSTIIKMA